MLRKLITLSIIFNNYIFSVNLNDLYVYLKTVNNGIYNNFDNITYATPTVNYIDLSKNWLLQTPGIWGHSIDELNESKAFSVTKVFNTNVSLSTCSANSDCGKLSYCAVAKFTLNNDKLCLTPQYEVLNVLATNIESASYTVDMSQLGFNGFSSAEFTYTIKNSLYKLALKSISLNREIDVRLIEGSYMPDTVNTLSIFNSELDILKSYFKDLVSSLPANNKLKISIANINSCSPIICHKLPLILDFSWNHAKIVNIDNNDIIVGGEDFIGNWYLGKNPAADILIDVQGPVASIASNYLDILWNYVDNHRGLLENKCYTYENNNITDTCLTKMIKNISLKNNKTNLLPVMAMPIAKLDGNILNDNADESELSKVFMLKNATSSIYISQQGLYQKAESYAGALEGPVNTVDGTVIDAIAFAIYYHHVIVKIITSNLIGNPAASFSSGADLNYVRNDIKKSLIKLTNMSDSDANNLLNQFLSLSNIDYNHSNSKENLSHLKFWEIDNHIVYMGSHNFYPAGLQEFGLIIDNEQIVDMINQSFWNPMWNNSDLLNNN